MIVGKPMPSHRLSEEKISKWKALAVLSSDALSSVAYATEEILIPLAAVSAAALAWSVPVAIAIGILLIIVSASYRQTIEAYSNGGGAYVVAKENIGVLSGLVAGAALLIGYVLTVSVSVAAGVSAITSAFPEVYEFRVMIAVIVIGLITWMNLRGIRESATVFAFPTYIFIISFFVMMGVGAWKIWTGQAVQAHPILHDSYPPIAMFLVFRAFSSGCAALTGIEAISNGVPSFKAPAHTNAKITLTWMAALLVVLFFGITALSHVYGIVPRGGEMAVSQLARAVFGTNWFYYVIQVSTALILVLAANTSYNGFPWLAAVLAHDRFLPRQMAILGDRLVYSNSIIWLSIAAAILVILFQGETHSLIPLYAVGVFLGFTLSQAGMLKHHLKHKKPGWMRAFAINALGAVTTFIVMLVVGATKFSEGAWIVVLLIPFCVFIFYKINRHYLSIGAELSLMEESAPSKMNPVKHTVVIPISGVHRGVVEALRYGISISDDVRAVYVEIDPQATERVKQAWEEWAHEIPFVVLKSPYRSIIKPLLEYVDDLSNTVHSEIITVIVPEFVTAHWWHQILHNQTAFLIRAALLFKKGKVVTSVRYHIKGI